MGLSEATKRGVLVGVWVLALALGACVQDVSQAPNADNPGGDMGWADGEPFEGAGEGLGCATSNDCAESLRCLRRGDSQFCVRPCLGAADCTSAVCNPVDGSDLGWCTPPTGLPGDMGGPAPSPEPDTAPDPDPGPKPDLNPDPDPVPEPEPQAANQPGESCDCDGDCADIDGASGICVRGICMMRATSTCSRNGSQAECPTGSRCWAGSGTSICYPDCGGFGECDGTCDNDNSCVPSQNMDCYSACGALCGRSGTPPGGDPGTDPNPEPDPQPGPNPDPGPMGDCGIPQESDEFRLTNTARAMNGLPAFECGLDLAAVARDHSQDMAQRGFFSHTNPEGQQPWDRMRSSGITNFRTAGENIAYGYPSPEAVHNGWMNSSGHRANILSRSFTHMGVGAYNHNGTWYWTQVFAAY